MNLSLEIIQFLLYSILIVLVSKYLLIRVLRRLGELLKLETKTIGNIAGIATSIPELLTVSFSAFKGLIATSIYNVLSSNIINLIQYGVSILLNKNQKLLKSKAIKIDLSLVIITILIPMVMIFFNIENNVSIIPFFIIILLIFYKISNNAHKLYSKTKEKETKIKKEEINKGNISVENFTKKNLAKVVTQALLLVFIGIILYFIGNALSNVLDSLCRKFNVSEFIIGTLLGMITSIPELVTFFESQKYHKKEEEGITEATGNLLTSNIMNLCIIQSIGIVIYNMFK